MDRRRTRRSMRHSLYPPESTPPRPSGPAIFRRPREVRARIAANHPDAEVVPRHPQVLVVALVYVERQQERPTTLPG